MGWRRALATVVLVGAFVGVVSAPALPAAADPGDVGWEGPSFQGATGSPSGSKPQSKVWFNDGLWWATLFDAASGDFHIFRLDVGGRSWVDTGTLVDTRPNSRSDALWTGQSLYIANHVFSESSSASGNPALLRRYRYDAATKTYALDAGFPVAINDVRSETLVIDREPGGRLWATWVQDGVVEVTHTTTDDRTWASPFPLPGAARASSDDISSVIAYRSDRIGVLWSDQDREQMFFSQHLDAAAPGAWSAPEVAFTGPRAADDHINLAAVQDAGGRVLAAVKTSASGSDVLTHLLDRDPTTGHWTSHPFGRATDSHTRPIVVVDTEHRVVHMFATSGQSGGSVYEKVAPLDAIDFPAGKGTPVLTDASSADINNATSTKQNVTSASGLVVVATNDSTRRYWTHVDPLGAAPPPAAPVASFTVAPASGTAPLDVAFTDTSTGGPTAWRWDFGDGTTSTVRSPAHRYAAPGTYDVSLTATNAGGSRTTTRTGAVTVRPAPPAAPVASFTVAPASGTAPLDVAFTDTSTGGPTAWRWDFGDGTTSTVRSPGHRYAAPGTYDVSLTATNAGGSATTTTVGAVTATAVPPATPSAALVARIYQDVLGRPVDPAGLEHWSALLDAGQISARWLASALLGSAEVRGRVADEIYQRVLDRLPAPEARAHRAEQLRTATREQVEAEVLASAELLGKAGGTAEGFVAAVYQRVLGRAPDPGGAAWWAPRAETAAGRRAMADAFLAGLEHRRLVVTAWYRLLLRRDPDPAGLTYWATALGSHLTQESLAATLAGSPEYVRRATEA